MADGNAPNGDPPFSAAKPVWWLGPGRHRERFERCIHCDVPTERRKYLPGTYPPNDYDWCPRCGMAVWCACEGCEVLRALARL
jgi:hypothetical protein